MNANEEKWLEHYIVSGDGNEAVKIAYPDVQAKSRSSKAAQLKNRLAPEIHKRSIELYGKEAPRMMKIIRELAENSQQDAVRLKAASEWLTRAKHDAPLEVNVTDKRSYEELQKQLQEQLNQADDSLLKAVGLSREALTELANQDNAKHTEH